MSITFTADVVFDGTLTSDVGALDLYITGPADVTHVAGGPDTWTGGALPAGTCLLEVRAFTAFATYTLTLSTR